MADGPESEDLTTAEAAELIQRSRDFVATLAREELLDGATQDRSTRAWRIPASSVAKWAKANPPLAGRSPWAKIGLQLRQHRVIRSILAIATIASGAGGAVALIAFVGPTTTATADEIIAERPGETLVVIASFVGGEESRPHIELKIRLREEAAQLNLTNVRFETVSVELDRDDRAGAVALGERYDASIMIWGEDTTVRVITNFLQLRSPGLRNRQFTIDQDKRFDQSELVPPAAYIQFIVEDLPSQLRFLSLYALSSAEYVSGGIEEATRLLEAAIDGPQPVHDSLPEAYSFLGTLYSEDAQYVKAINAFGRAIELDPNRVNSLVNRGMAYLRLGEPSRAIEDFDLAIDLEPTALALNNRGMAYGLLGDVDEAMSEFNRALDLDPTYAFAYSNRATGHYSSGQIELAIEDYSRAIELSPDVPIPYTNRGNMYAALGQFSLAFDDLNRAVEIDPSFAGGFDNRGAAYVSMGEFELAIEDFGHAIELDPTYLPGLYNRGGNLLKDWRAGAGLRRL